MTIKPPTARQLVVLRNQLLDLQFGLVNFNVYENKFKQQGRTRETLSREVFLISTYIELHTTLRN